MAPMRRHGSGRATTDLTVLAIPVYFGTMALEYLWLRRRSAREGRRPGDYERRDTVASLTMGVGSLLAPLVAAKVLAPFVPGKGRFGKVLVTTAAGAAALTTAADIVNRRIADASRSRTAAPGTPAAPAIGAPTPERPRASRSDTIARAARGAAAAGGVATVAAGGLAVTLTLASRTTAERFWRHRMLPDLGAGPLVTALAVAGWDFVYYWNHRFMHESRYMWAVHVVHHSSEHYNLSTALRQPVADALGTTIPYGALCLFGISPEHIEAARGINLLYQYWIHTETIDRLGSSEAVLNTPSHHRVHHGSNRQYLDRNHGSILILWDRIFGTFEPEGDQVVYGLTKNIDTFNPVRIAGHEYVDMLRDVARSTSWSERLSYVVRGPGWANRHRAEVEASSSTRPSPSESAGVGVRAAAAL